MSTINAEERQAIRDSFHRLLAETGREADVRRAMATDSGFDPVLWRAIADMGILGLLIPADFGGIGAGAEEIELVMEEAGAALLCGPLMSSGVLAASLLSYSSDEHAKARLLPAIGSGERIATVAITGDRGLWTPTDVSVTAVRDGDGWRLDGVASFVTAGTQADTLLVIAKAGSGLATFEVDRGAAGVAVTALKSFDRGQRFARIVFASASGAPIEGANEAAIEKMLDLARVALAGEQAGATRHVFDMTVEYIKTRVQFGRPIGGFQAIKHMAADLLIEVESATSAARHAARALAEGMPDTEVLVSLAAFVCADAFSQIAATSIQMHGGIGFTAEHPAHLYLRRARADAQLFGNSSLYRERYLSALEKAA
ncbi:MAG: Acyl-CoA dehydrogenase [Hydrocarboniphaga sp.]|uniref:acyl-CoA dehydrogenase family protein n=1 Tax=Hydrocarboniphaga sp. TaxID=2033016 RepID=UPI00262E1BC6|nr:acyl-CoA dehydrogenase family protein [Hydrocarboniphaga sp.]MDB5969884.1 Acyl-CoA dehydrogenase [Hydrocarboniphaga sp.]